jgi:hypothetical protein
MAHWERSGLRFWRRRSRSHTSLVVTLALVLALALTMADYGAGAEEMASESFRLQAGTLSGGGASGLTNPGSGATATADTTIGQTEPLGRSEGPDTGVTLEPGYWPVFLAVPEPSGWLSCASALAVLGLLARRRRSTA